MEELQSKKKTRRQELLAKEKANTSSNFLSRWSEYENIILKRKQEQDLHKKLKIKAMR